MRQLLSRLGIVRNSPRVGTLEWGDLRRTTPISSDFGFDRGTPIDRFYIEHFLQAHSADVHGDVMEVKEATYTRRYGGTRVKKEHVLDIDSTNRNATIIADLQHAPDIQSDLFDCIILTQVLQLIYDVPAVVRTLHRTLKPGGVLLLTVPGVTQIAYNQLGSTWYWSFTEASIRRLLGEAFPAANCSINVTGNVLAATAFLQGVSVEELSSQELSAFDPDYPMIISVRATKPVTRA